LSSLIESSVVARNDLPPAAGLRARWVRIVAFSWGFCAFFPVGLMYLHLLVLMLAMCFTPGLSARVRALRNNSLIPPLLLMVAWTLLAAVVGGMYPDLSTRVFHVVRVFVVLSVAVMLTREEAKAAFRGLLIGALFACLLIAVHRVWGLPDWSIWKSLIAPRNNFSSGNMMTMAIAAGVLVCLAMGVGAKGAQRWLSLLAACVLAATVVLHALSRNAQVLLALAPMTVVLHRFRSWRALLVGLALVASLMALAWHFSPTIQGRFAEVSSNLQAANDEARYNTSIGVRWRMYQEAVNGMRARPLFGQGVGSWLPHWKRVWASLDQRLPPEESIRFAEINNPHNDFLLAGVETGIPGMLILIWLFARIIRAGWRQRGTAGSITLMMAVAIAGSALVNAPLRDAALGMTLLWLLGASLAAHPEKPRG